MVHSKKKHSTNMHTMYHVLLLVKEVGMTLALYEQKTLTSCSYTYTFQNY